MKSDILIVIVPIVLAIVVGYVITHDMFVYKAEMDVRWQDRMFENYMEHDCQALKEQINELETYDYWFNSPNTSLIKAKV